MNLRSRGMNNILAIIKTVSLAALTAALCAPATATEQIPTIIGGSGKPRVEVNLDAINPGYGHSGGHDLLYPGESGQKTITLRLPAKLARSEDIIARQDNNRRINTSPSTLLKQRAQPYDRKVAVERTIGVGQNVRSVRVRQATEPVQINTKSSNNNNKQAVASNNLALVKDKPIGRDTNERKSTSTLQTAAADSLRLIFDPSSTRLDSGKENSLVAFARSARDGQQRIEIKAFASTAHDQHPSRARRVSLSRALAVRSHLIKQGVPSTKIDVRALGEPRDDTPADRVDVLLLPQ